MVLFPAFTVRVTQTFIAACLFTVVTVSICHAATENIPSPKNTSNNTKAQPLVNVKSLRWSDLTPAQQLALAPLTAEWDNLGPIRKEKWLKIADKFSSMKADERRRAQEKMREWVKLTPEQRRTIRENYARAKKLAPVQKTEKWKKYQQLSDEKKKNLASAVTTKKQVTNLPSSAQSKQKIVETIKVPQKTMPEKRRQ